MTFSELQNRAALKWNEQNPRQKWRKLPWSQKRRLMVQYLRHHDTCYDVRLRGADTDAEKRVIVADVFIRLAIEWPVLADVCRAQLNQKMRRWNKDQASWKRMMEKYDSNGQSL